MGQKTLRNNSANASSAAAFLLCLQSVHANISRFQSSVCVFGVNPLPAIYEFIFLGTKIAMMENSFLVANLFSRSSLDVFLFANM